MLREHRRVRDAEGFLVGARGGVDQIYIGLDHLRDADALVDVVAAFGEFGGAHAELDREKRTDRLADRFQHLDGQAAAVFEGAAVLVGAVVEERGEELVDEPAVAAVDHEHLKTGSLRKARHMSVGGNDLSDHLLRERPDLDAVETDRVAGAPLVQGFLFALVGHVSAGEHAGVGELEGRDGPVAADRVGRIGRAGKRVQDALVQMVGVGAVRGRVHHALRDGDRAGAAFASQLVKCGRFRPDAAVVRDVGAAHRGGEHAVAEGGAAEGDGLAEMRIFVFHEETSLENEVLVRCVCKHYCLFARTCISLFCCFCF